MPKFKPGQSGNPRGRPPGPSKLTRLSRALLEDNAEQIMQVVIAKALAGDATAMKLLVPRLCPAPRTPPTPFTLPKDISSIEGLARATDQIITAVADGTLTCENARDIQQLLSAKRQILEISDVERRLSNLEAQIAVNRRR